jgi:hypothetical protein
MGPVHDLYISEVLRGAITRHIEERRQDPEFREGLRRRMERARLPR